MSYVLENDVLTLECVEKGGEMQHLLLKSSGREVLYQGNQGWSGKNPSLFPMVGNTFSKEYVIDGKTYAMKNHGLIRYATLKGNQSQDEIVFELDANEDTLKQYPFDFHYEIHYKLDGNRVCISYKIQNKGNEDMPFGFGLHPGFKLDDAFSEYSLEFEKEEHAKQLLFDPSFEKKIEYQDVVLKEWKLSREDIKKYATIIYKDLSSYYVTLKHHEKPIVRVSIQNFPFLALWSHETPSDFLCIEPWYSHADFEKDAGDFYHREGTVILKPNEEWSCSYWIEVEG